MNTSAVHVLEPLQQEPPDFNTGGGQISAGQAGLAGGGTNLVEAVRQLFGQAGARQVANRRNALVTGIGSIPYARNWGTSAVLILGSDG